MIIRPYVALISLAGGLAFSGCTTLDQQRQMDARRQIDLQHRQADLHMLRTRVEDLTTAQEQIYARLDQLESARRDTQKNLTEIQQSLVELDAKRATDREAILNALSQKISGLLQSSGGRGGGRMTGREHVVQPGETLSAIASAYGVSMRAIVKANPKHLKNPDALRVGQKIFIPD